MRGFMKFLFLSLLLIAGFITYYIFHPTNSMIVRQGAQWVVLEHNITSEDKRSK